MRIFTIAAILTLVANNANADDPIVGNWKTGLGDTAAIASCGGDYCITLKSGKHAGKQIGTFQQGRRICREDNGSRCKQNL